MGLDAVVYLRKGGDVQLDGEQLGSDRRFTELTSSATEAIHKRLGNATMIAALRDEIFTFLDKDALLLTKVLYSGSHSGDEIKVQDIERLDLEIRSTREKSGASRSLAVEKFLEDMSELVEKAREQGSPITFV